MSVCSAIPVQRSIYCSDTADGHGKTFYFGRFVLHIFNSNERILPNKSKYQAQTKRDEMKKSKSEKLGELSTHMVNFAQKLITQVVLSEFYIFG